jgi:Zn-dependent peptidase ImmA (M78 family)
MAVFNNAINYSAGSSLSSFFSSRNSYDHEKELVRKVDLLFEKVQAILDMRKRMRKVRVRLFSNSDQLQKAYQKIFGSPCHVRGWYVYDFNTVFLNVRDVHEGMLAHELGHAIIDHYLTVRPPRATAEILAKYVDKHLFDEVKKY